MSQSGEILERFHAVLLQEIADKHPDDLTAPFTVAEIYQDLVPYRSHRDLIGVEMNGDYEDALFRMLSGEGDYLVLDSEHARQEIQDELARPNPNAALFRGFAAVDVRLHPSRLPSTADVEDGPEESVEILEELGIDRELMFEPPAAAPAAAPEAAAEEPQQWFSNVGHALLAEADAVESEAESVEPPGPESVEPLEPESAEAGEESVVGHIERVPTPPVASAEESASDEAVSTEAEPDDVLTVCLWCREDLPQRDTLCFCPFCGSDLRPSPCRECGEAMEAQWQFCVSCGTDIRG